MAYIDEDFYLDKFHGANIPSGEFERLVEIASDVIDSIVSCRIDFDTMDENSIDCVKRATAYEVEHLYHQGGVEAINGFAASGIQSESLGSYRITGSTGSNNLTFNGIPVAALALTFLRRANLMSRWVYKGTRLDNG